MAMFFDMCCSYADEPKDATVQRVVMTGNAAPFMHTPCSEADTDVPIILPHPKQSSRDLTPVKPTEEVLASPHIETQPAATSGSFRVGFDMGSGQILGLEFDMLDAEVCIVSTVLQSGLAESHNRQEGLPEDEQIRPYDQVLAMNGMPLQKSQDLQNQLSSAKGWVELSFKHPRKSTFTIDRDGQKLGLALAASKANPSICVKRLDKDGAVNLKNKADGQTHLRPHDRIIEVNGKASNRAEMARALAENIVTLTICSYQLPAGINNGLD